MKRTYFADNTANPATDLTPLIEAFQKAMGVDKCEPTEAEEIEIAKADIRASLLHPSADDCPINEVAQQSIVLCDLILDTIGVTKEAENALNSIILAINWVLVLLCARCREENDYYGEGPECGEPV